MGQQVHPKSFRLQTNASHDSNWFANKKDYAKFLHEDIRIREYIENKYRKADVSRVYISRNSGQVDITIFTYKVGAILGRKGEQIDNLKKEISKLTESQVKIGVKEIPFNILSARVLGLSVAQAIEKRIPFKKAMNQALNRAKKARVNGVKIIVSGRLNGAEIARSEKVLFGKVPLHSLKYDIDYASVEAMTISGIIGIKVYISNGVKMDKDSFTSSDNRSKKRGDSNVNA